LILFVVSEGFVTQLDVINFYKIYIDKAIYIFQMQEYFPKTPS
jgi:hypothetical protein